MIWFFKSPATIWASPREGGETGVPSGGQLSESRWGIRDVAWGRHREPTVTENPGERVSSQCIFSQKRTFDPLAWAGEVQIPRIHALSVLGLAPWQAATTRLQVCLHLKIFPPTLSQQVVYDQEIDPKKASVLSVGFVLVFMLSLCRQRDTAPLD